MTLFERIIAREIPAQIEYEDDICIAFRDIQPQAPLHILVIPKKPIARLAEADRQDQTLLGHLLLVAQRLAAQEKVDRTGFRIVINNGPHGGESVPHLHIHLLGGRPMAWPPG